MKLAIPPIPTQLLNFGLVSWLVTDLVLIHPFRLFVEKNEFGGLKGFLLLNLDSMKGSLILRKGHLAKLCDTSSISRTSGKKFGDFGRLCCYLRAVPF